MMKIFSISILAALMTSFTLRAQTFCFLNGNVIVYSNYDGGYLNIDVDQNITDLKIGITTYEKTEVHIFGQYVSNVTEVIYAGYNGNNDHCNPSPPTTNIFGVANSIDTIIIYPPVTWTNAAGWNYGIVCNYSCDSLNYQGGCNTPDQIVHYYIAKFGGSLYYHYTQYGCWQDTFHVSQGGNCCIGASIIPPQFSIQANFSVADDTVCAKDSIFFFNSSLNSYPGATTYSWDFGDGFSDTAANPVHSYNVAGTYTVTLIATNSNGSVSDTVQLNLVAIDCITGVVNFVDPQVKIFPNPATGWFQVTVPPIENGCVQLYNLEGHLISSTPLKTNSALQTILIPVEGLASGFYYLQVKMDANSFWKKLMIE